MTTIPAAALGQHIAILGKTGSGKTSTGKLAIEQVVADSNRVCILDPIKSDWWGLISSRDGKHAGLPFHILGGPRGHVPLHPSAGKAIGELVATGALPLSIIDMADFPPGGQAQFFTDFAPALLRKMRGVVYLVIEEAHLFAPKERAGFGKENLSIHWAKMLATAGRSKGVRLILVTQRTQALHNALLGSCDTLIAHRLTAPADQEPVVKWLRSNVEKATADQVASSLAQLKTGAGWICSGEARIFERVEFPRIHTYDNTATPDKDSAGHEVKTAPVDLEHLRAVLGEAVKQAEADDPRELRRTIAALRKDLAAAQQASNRAGKMDTDPGAITAAVARGRAIGERDAAHSVKGPLADVQRRLASILGSLEMAAAREIPAPPARQSAASVSLPVGGAPAYRPDRLKVTLGDRVIATTQRRATPARPVNGGADDVRLNRLAERKVLQALVQHGTRTQRQLAILTGYAASGGGFRGALGKLRTLGLIDGSDPVSITDAGRQAIGEVEPLPTGRALVDHWLGQFNRLAEREVLRVIVEAYPESVPLEEVARRTNPPYEAAGGGFRGAVGKLRTLGLIEGRSEVRASADLVT